MTVVIIWYMCQGIILFIFSRNEITDALLPQVSDGGFGRRIVHGYDGHRVWIVGGNGNHETGVSISVERAVCQIQGSVIVPQSQMFAHRNMGQGLMGLIVGVHVELGLSATVQCSGVVTKIPTVDVVIGTDTAAHAVVLFPFPFCVLHGLHLLVLVEPVPGLVQVVVDHLLQVGQTLLGVDHGGEDVVLMTRHYPARLQPRGLTNDPTPTSAE